MRVWLKKRQLHAHAHPVNFVEYLSVPLLKLLWRCKKHEYESKSATNLTLEFITTFSASKLGTRVRRRERILISDENLSELTFPSVEFCPESVTLAGDISKSTLDLNIVIKFLLSQQIRELHLRHLLYDSGYGRIITVNLFSCSFLLLILFY
jgi:hypothetical protein